MSENNFDNKNFKNEVLNILGLKIDLQQPSEDKDSWTKIDGKPVVNTPSSKDEKQIQDYVNKIIDTKIKNLVGKANENDKKSVFKELNDSLKSFTLDDILHHVKGFGVGKGFYQAKEENVSKKDTEGNVGREAEIFKYGENNWLKYEGACGTIGDFYTVRVNHKLVFKSNEIKGGISYIFKDEDEFKKGKGFTAKPGDIILALKTTNNNKFFEKGDKKKTDSPAQTLEKGLQTVYGGKLNPGHTDSVKDMQSGVDVSVKCWNAKNNYYGSLDAIANYNREVKLIVFNYDIYDGKGLANRIFNDKNKYKGFVFCRKNEGLSGMIKNGELIQNNKKTTIVKKDNLDYKTLQDKILPKISEWLLRKKSTKKDYKTEVNNFINKLRESSIANQFKNCDAIAGYYNTTLRSEIKSFLKEQNIKDRSGTDVFINNIIEGNINSVNNKASVHTCFDY